MVANRTDSSHLEDDRGWGMEQDLYLISKIEIDPFFLPKNTKSKKDGRRLSLDDERASSSTIPKEGPPKRKYLGDWVSEAKMKTVRDSCRKTYGE